MIQRLILLLAILFVVAAPIGALSLEPEELLEDPALEQRAREISKGLRCVVCDNQSIDDSNAQIAQDMRRLVRERLVAGDSDQEVEDLMVSYYGEFVLLQPRFSWRNLALWLLPVGALAVGVFWMRRRLGQPAGGAPVDEARSDAAAAPLDEQERRRLDALLKD